MRNFRFWQIFHHSYFWLVSQLQVSKWQSRVFLCWFEGFLEFWGWVKILSKLKIFMTAVLKRISDFDHLFKTFISDLWVICKFKNGILECSYVHLKDFWKFEVESKFCQKLKIFMTSFLNEISDFDHLFKTFIFRLVSQLQVSKWHSKVFLCWFEGFLEVWGWVKILSKLKNFMNAVSAKFLILTTFFRLSFWLVSQLQV